MNSAKNLRRVTMTLLFFSLLFPTVVAEADRDDDGYPRLMQGPMVGVVTPTQAKIWGRTTGEYSVTLEYATNFEMRSAKTPLRS